MERVVTRVVVNGEGGDQGCSDEEGGDEDRSVPVMFPTPNLTHKQP